MPQDRRTLEEARTAARYFGSFAEDYHAAFAGRGANPLHRLINRLFRRSTFVRRTEVVERLLSARGVAGKTVLDLGCGSGEVALVAARLGARVIGLDIVEAMVRIAREEAAAAGITQAEFRVADILEERLPAADIVLMIGVIEYYSDLAALFARVCQGTREAVIIVDTRGPAWRRMLRYALARFKRFNVFYRSPERVAALMRAQGFAERDRIAGHSYTVFGFERTGGAQ